MRSAFQSKSFSREIASARYRKLVNRHPFLLFGLPFISLVVAGSFFLTPVAAVRYEKNDKKVRHVSKEEALNVGKNKRKVDMKEEYYVRGYTVIASYLHLLTPSSEISSQRHRELGTAEG